MQANVRSEECAAPVFLRSTKTKTVLIGEEGQVL
jgi:hypothetical protein